MPTKPDPTAVVATEPLVRVRDLDVHYAIRQSALARLFGRSSGVVKSVDGVDLDVAPGEVLGVIGESGAGKSTLGRALIGLVRPSAGTVEFAGQSIGELPESRLRPLRTRMQMVFQDPHAALNPSMTIGAAIADALRIHGVPSAERATEVDAALERVGLSPAARFSPKYPAELSGGQKQRAVIARAISLKPELLVADEPISMLDMSVRAKILGLLTELKRDLGLTYVYITHDLASARFFCDRIAIMYLGRIVEIGPTEEIFDQPRHPYTRALLRAVPDPDPERRVPRQLPRGEVPDAAAPPAGCRFHPRCESAFSRCGWEVRDLRVVFEQRWTRVPAEQFAEEAELVGDLHRVDVIAGDVLPVGKGSAADLLALLERMRADDPDEPFWSAVDGMAVQDGGVRLTFARREDPPLLPLADGGNGGNGGSAVRVACHLHHPPATVHSTVDG